jgi:hypothetical protein
MHSDPRRIHRVGVRNSDAMPASNRSFGASQDSQRFLSGVTFAQRGEAG